MKRNGEVYYPMLKSEIVRRDILKNEIKKALGISHATFSQKLNGKTEFT